MSLWEEIARRLDKSYVYYRPLFGEGSFSLSFADGFRAGSLPCLFPIPWTRTPSGSSLLTRNIISWTMHVTIVGSLTPEGS